MEREATARIAPPAGAAQRTRAAASSAKRPRSKVQARQRTMAAHKWLRFAVQVAFFILAPGVFASAMSGVRLIFADLGAMQPIEFGSFVVVLAAALSYTVVFGRFFCGYACAFGTMGDALYLAGAPLRKLLHLEGARIRGRLASALSLLKVALLAVICALCFTNLWDGISAHDPWTAFGLAVGGTFTGLDAIGLALLGAIMVFQLLFERSFCRFLCPMSALFSLVPVLPFSQFGRRRERCGKRWCNRCIDACPAGIYPDKGSNAFGECFACGRCADVCPLENVHLILLADAGAAAAGSGSSAAGGHRAADGPEEEAKRRAKNRRALVFKGTSAGYVLLRAAILLVLLWLLGATRFLPDASAVLPFAYGIS